MSTTAAASPSRAVQDAFAASAIRLAGAAEFADRLANDPNLVADRSSSADAWRREEYADALDEYRSALALLTKASAA